MERDSEQFIELLTAAQTPVFAFIMSITHNRSKAQDILQETNLTLWRKAEKFEEGTNFNAWACRIAYFRVLNMRRKDKKEQLVFDEDVLDYLAERQEQRADQSNIRLEALQICVDKLPENSRKLIKERYTPGASVREMATDRGKSEGAISQALLRIRGALHECVEKQFAIEGL